MAAGALAVGALLSSGLASPPGTVTVARVLPGGRGTLSLTAQWATIKRPGHAVELGGFSARFNTCHRGSFMDLKQYCVGLANPYFTGARRDPARRNRVSAHHQDGRE